MKITQYRAKVSTILAGLIIFVLFGFKITKMAQKEEKVYGIVIHGGAGVITREKLTPDVEMAYKAALQEVIDTCFKKIAQGESAMEVACFAVSMMEDNPLFNAGRGSVLNEKGAVEMDASVMDGKSGKAGSVAGISRVKNPVLLAREVMMHSPHVMLIGNGAEEFAKERGLPLKKKSYFLTEERVKQWHQHKKNRKIDLDHSPGKKYGTVGAVVLDKSGNIAAATSTGGMSNKKYGRVGDSPIIGAGTYAENGVCGISCTGHGEYFIRYVVAYDVAARMKYRGMSLSEAAHEVIHQVLLPRRGEGGLIGLDAKGNIVVEFNTAGMYRAARSSRGEQWVKIYGN